jgi:hypothetical protein
MVPPAPMIHCAATTDDDGGGRERELEPHEHDLAARAHVHAESLETGLLAK